MRALSRSALAAAVALAATLAVPLPARAVPLADLVRRCAAHVAPRTALAIIAVESSGAPWSINDDTARRSYRFASRAEAEAFAWTRVAQGANLDLGLTQVNTSNLARLGVSIDEIFEPCTNIAMGMQILAEAFVDAERRYGYDADALYHAFAEYNSGSLCSTTNDRPGCSDARSYASLVWQTAASMPMLSPGQR